MTSEEREGVDASAAEMRMIRWMCGVKLTDWFMCCELRERLGIDDIITTVQRHICQDGMSMF